MKNAAADRRIVEQIDSICSRAATTALSWKVSLANQAVWLVFILSYDAWGLLPLTLAPDRHDGVVSFTHTPGDPQFRLLGEPSTRTDPESARSPEAARTSAYRRPRLVPLRLWPASLNRAARSELAWAARRYGTGRKISGRGPR